MKAYSNKGKTPKSDVKNTTTKRAERRAYKKRVRNAAKQDMMAEMDEDAIIDMDVSASELFELTLIEDDFWY